MRKKNILLIVASSLLLLSLILHTAIGAQLNLQIIEPVKASAKTIIVPTNYDRIQEAINAADPGDTIYVYNGTYFENVVVDKNITLIGENRSTTIIDGKGGIVVRINAPDVEIRGFTVQNGGDSPNSSIILGSCIGNTIRGNIIRNSAYGIMLSGSNGCSIIDNIIMNNSWAGVYILDSSYNTVCGNTIAKNSWGVWITPPCCSFNNTLHHNNFMDNLSPPQSFGRYTKWDNGTEGNYWSDYTGVDADGDGVGDTEIPHLGMDKYPLIIPTRPFPVVWDDLISLVAVLGNSTVSGFYFSWSSKEIGFYVNGFLNKTGFCNVTIPKQLLWGNPWIVRDADGNSLSFVPSVNITHTSLYLTYNHSVQMIRIIGTEVIPEFPAAIVLPLFIIVTLVAVVLRKRKKETFEL